jgi:hypothetical protein
VNGYGSHLRRDDYSWRQPCLLRLDEIHMPARASFAGSATSTATEAYYSTLLHELTHYADLRIMPRRCRSRETIAESHRGMSA